MSFYTFQIKFLVDQFLLTYYSHLAKMPRTINYFFTSYEVKNGIFSVFAKINIGEKEYDYIKFSGDDITDLSEIIANFIILEIHKTQVDTKNDEKWVTIEKNRNS